MYHTGIVDSMQMTFRQKVYEVARQIPAGKVATYGQLARIAGNSKAARAVGMFMKRNPEMKTIPCHRVVASDGDLKGYTFGEGVKTKKEMLLGEGVSFTGHRVNLASSLWTP